jgi:hypothetical protein
VKCPECGHEAPDGAARCPRCDLEFAKWTAWDKRKEAEAPSEAPAGVRAPVLWFWALTLTAVLWLAGHWALVWRTGN